MQNNVHRNASDDNDTIVTAMTWSRKKLSIHSLTSSLLGTVLISTAIKEVEDLLPNNIVNL